MLLQDVLAYISPKLFLESVVKSSEPEYMQTQQFYSTVLERMCLEIGSRVNNCVCVVLLEDC